MKYGMAKLNIPAIVKAPPDTVGATPTLTSPEELMQTLNIVRGIFQLPQVS
jgi:hypothetical protein